MNIEARRPGSRPAARLLLLGALCCAALFASANCIVLLSLLMTVGFDEAWNLLSVRQVVHGASELTYVKTVLTSGGLYAALNGALYALGFEGVIWHRLISLSFFLATVVVIYRHVRANAGRMDALVAATVFASVPGGLYLASGAYAEPVATFLVVFVALHLPVARLKPLVVVALGLLCGLAAATRSPAIVFTAGAALYVLLAGRTSHRAAMAALLGTVAAAAFFALNYAYIFASPTGGLDWGHVAGATGVSLRTDYPFLLNKLIVGDRLLPAFYLAGVTLLLVASHDKLNAGDQDIVVFCILNAVILGVFWLIFAPIPHLRYLWPALPLIWTSFAIISASLYRTSVPVTLKAVIMSVALFVLGYQVLVAGRNVLFGNNDLISFEQSGESAITYFRWLSHKQDEQDAARRLSEVDLDTIHSMGQEYPLQLLTGKTFVPTNIRSPRTGEYLLLTWRNQLNPTTFECLESNADLVWQTGAYSLYKMRSACDVSGEQNAYDRHPQSLPAFGSDRIEYEQRRRTSP